VLHGADGSVIPLSPADLPVTLPEVKEYKPTGSPEGPLAKATDWLKVERDGKTYTRETNTMPQWAGSCWYYLRYIDPKNDKAFADKAKLDAWLPVDLYVGGAEHAVLHLLYARFWHKVLFDRGYVSCPEPFHRLVNQGMILGEMEYHASPEAVAAKQDVLAKLGVTPIHRPAKEEGDEETYILPIGEDQIEKKQGKTTLKPGERRQSGRCHQGLWRGFPASLRDVHGPARSGQTVEHERRRGGLSFPEPGLAVDRRRVERDNRAQSDGQRATAER
jgi:leucyl-tRNA synthetase